MAAPLVADEPAAVFTTGAAAPPVVERPLDDVADPLFADPLFADPLLADPLLADPLVAGPVVVEPPLVGCALTAAGRAPS